MESSRLWNSFFKCGLGTKREQNSGRDVDGGGVSCLSNLKGNHYLARNPRNILLEPWKTTADRADSRYRRHFVFRNVGVQFMGGYNEEVAV